MASCPRCVVDSVSSCTSVSSCRWRVSDVGRLLDPYQPEVAVCTWLALPPPSHGLHPFRAMMMVLRIGCCSRLHRLHACGHIAARSASRLTPNLSRNQLGPSGLTVLVMVITWVGPNLGWASCTCIAVTGVASRSEVNAGLAGGLSTRCAAPHLMVHIHRPSASRVRTWSPNLQP